MNTSTEMTKGLPLDYLKWVSVSMKGEFMQILKEWKCEYF